MKFIRPGVVLVPVVIFAALIIAGTVNGESFIAAFKRIRGMYWDELLLPHLTEFEVRAQLLPSNDYLYEFDDTGDIAAFEREQGLMVAM